VKGDIKTQSIEEFRELLSRMTGNAKRKKPAEPETPLYPEADEPVTIRLELPPTVNHYYREQGIPKGYRTTKTGKRVPHIMVIKPITTRGREYRQHVFDVWAERIRRRFAGRLAIRVDVVWPNRRACDLDNRAKSLFDALQQAGAYANDSQLKLVLMIEAGIEKPGWVTVTLGHLPGEVQGTLFDAKW